MTPTWEQAMTGLRVWTFANGVSAYGEITGYAWEDDGAIFVVLDDETEPTKFFWGDVRPERYGKRR